MTTNAFGNFLQQKRTTKDLSIEDVATASGMLAGDYEDIESGALPPCDTEEDIEALRTASSLSPAEVDMLYDLAAESRGQGQIPADILAYVRENENLRRFLRAAQKEQLTAADWKKLTDKANAW